LTGHTTIGTRNQFHAGCVIGDAPQDLKYAGEPTKLRIGDRNRFREHVTVHRSNSLSEDTVIGSDNFLMAHSHVGHNSRLGNSIILANGALLGGHVSVADRAFISGNCLVHQFVRVGMLALMQGGAAISKDLPPFTIAYGDNSICGLNTVGLRRAGVSGEQRTELKRLYHALFREGENIAISLASAQKNFPGEYAQILLQFIASSQRGFAAQPSLLAGHSKTNNLRFLQVGEYWLTQAGHSYSLFTRSCSPEALCACCKWCLRPYHAALS
jgi:UDP-N-acetylglucosamine acyltransferase